MVDLDLDLDAASHHAKAAVLAALVVVFARVQVGILLGQLHRRDQQVVRLVARPGRPTKNEQLRAGESK